MLTNCLESQSLYLNQVIFTNRQKYISESFSFCLGAQCHTTQIELDIKYLDDDDSIMDYFNPTLLHGTRFLVNIVMMRLHLLKHKCCH